MRGILCAAILTFGINFVEPTAGSPSGQPGASSLPSSDSSRMLVFDQANLFDFSSGRRIIPGPTTVDPTLLVLLDSLNTDSIVQIVPAFNPADTLQSLPGGRIVQLNDLSRLCVVYFHTAIDTDMFNSLYSAIDSTAIVNTIADRVSMSVIPDDPLFDSQIHLQQDSSSITAGFTGAWERTRGLPSQRIGIIDDGFEGTHTDLLNRFYDGVSYSSEPWFENSEPRAGHGTAVSGVILSSTNNGFGTAGINWYAQGFGANLELFHLIGAFGDTIRSYLSPEQVVAAIERCTAEGLSITNASLGGVDAAATAMVSGNMWLVGQQLVAARGNFQGSDAVYPASHKSVYSVSALNSVGTLWGPSSFFGVDCTALGVEVLTTSINNANGKWNGTSFSSPIAAGCLSLIQAADTTLTMDEITGVLELTAKDIGALGYDVLFGWGAVDAAAAVDLVRTHDFVRLTSTNAVQDGIDQPYVEVVEAKEVPIPVPKAQYNILRRPILATVNYAHLGLTQPPKVIVRTRETAGYGKSQILQPFDFFPDAEVVNVTSTYCELETYAYRLDGDWFPCNTSNCSSPEIEVAVTLVVPHEPQAINVPIEEQTIAAAVARAKDGDTIMVEAGTHTGPDNRNVRLDGKRIVIRTTPGAEGLAIIDCEGQGRAFTVDNFEPAAVEIRDLVIRNGNATNGGGGILIQDSDVSIINCRFDSCVAPVGGAICVKNEVRITSPTIENCTFASCQSTVGGGGAIFLGARAQPRVQNCVFEDNQAIGNGGAIWVQDSIDVSADIQSSLFVNNGASGEGGAIYVGSYANLSRNTFVGSTSSASRTAAITIAASADSAKLFGLSVTNNSTYGLDCYTSANVSITCCNLWSNTGGQFNPLSAIQVGDLDGSTIFTNPLYCNPTIGNYAIAAQSLCAAANNSCSIDIGAFAAACGTGFPPAQCCVGLVGNVNGIGGESANLADLSALYDHLFISFTPLPCPAEANCDGDPASLIGLSDLSALIDHLFVTLSPLPACQ